MLFSSASMDQGQYFYFFWMKNKLRNIKHLKKNPAFRKTTQLKIHPTFLIRRKGCTKQAPRTVPLNLQSTPDFVLLRTKKNIWTLAWTHHLSQTTLTSAMLPTTRVSVVVSIQLKCRDYFNLNIFFCSCQSPAKGRPMGTDFRNRLPPASLSCWWPHRVVQSR